MHQRHRVRAASATALDAFAAALTAPVATRDLASVQRAVDALEARTGIVYRPAGSMARDRALVALVVSVRRIPRLLDLLDHAERSAAADTLPEYARLAERTAAAVAASARLLGGDDATAVDLDAVVQARADHTVALERWAADELGRAGAEHVVARFDAAFPLRRASLLALELANRAAEATGGTVVASDPMGIPDVAHPDRSSWAVLRGHLNARSVRFRTACRAGIGLAAAVLVAKGMSVDHTFWVVLGTLSVLRSNTLGTGATALQALLGAFVGFGVASAVMLTVGSDRARPLGAPADRRVQLPRSRPAR